ncbi:MAG TPA: hypothetical protein VHE54_14470 [Puia sp.]|nr:hypothetical protein [Puia sp.]
MRFRPGAPAEVIGALIRATGWPAEVHNTLLKRVEVELVGQGAACV